MDKKVMIFLAAGIVCLFFGLGLSQWQSIVEENVPSIPENSSFSGVEKSLKSWPLRFTMIGVLLIVISIGLLLAEEVFS